VQRAALRACSRWGRRWAPCPGSGRCTGLRRTLPAFDAFFEHRRGQCHRVQEGALAQPPCGSGSLDRISSAGELMAPPATTKWRATTRVPRTRLGACRSSPPARTARPARALRGKFQRLGARLHQQRGATVQRRGNGGHQHRLLGVGGAAHAAGAQVPAALDVAQDGRPRRCPACNAPTFSFSLLALGAPARARCSGAARPAGTRATWPRRSSRAGRSARARRPAWPWACGRNWSS
jgi:hypothetical protein